MSVDHNDLQNLALLNRLIDEAESTAYRLGMKKGFEKSQKMLMGIVIGASVVIVGLFGVIIWLLVR